MKEEDILIHDELMASPILDTNDEDLEEDWAEASCWRASEKLAECLLLGVNCVEKASIGRIENLQFTREKKS